MTPLARLDVSSALDPKPSVRRAVLTQMTSIHWFASMEHTRMIEDSVRWSETLLHRTFIAYTVLHNANLSDRWFSVTMGTGIVSILLHNLPYNARWLSWISVVFFVLNVILFVIFTLLSIVRYTMYPEIWKAMIRHPTQSLFLGTFPMGFATIVNMFVFVCVPAWGSWAVTMAWTMWWVDVAFSVATCFYLPFIM